MTETSFISYAQNREDVMLWRALRDQEPGCFIEAGANPAAPGITRALAEHGWRGVAVGSVSERDGPVHVLKTGADAAALRDLAQIRPWIVVLEAVASEPAAAECGAILAAAGYVPVWFDGLSRFYVAGERHAALSQHFVSPPNPSDGYVTPEQVDAAWLRERVAALEAELAGLRPAPAARAQPRRAAWWAYGLVRPVLRPLAWRLRTFLVGPLRDELAGLRARQDAILARLDHLAAERAGPRLDASLRRSLEAVLLSVAAERDRE